MRLPQQSDTLALDISNLSHQFKNHRALNNVSFQVEQGSIHGFVGSNGAGKTTTLRVVSTLDRVQQGTVRVFGLNVARQRVQVRATLGFMPDHFSMYRTMQVEEYLDFFAAAYGLPQHSRQKVVDDVLVLTDMDARRADRIKGLSRGMQQRLSLARVLINDPKLLLLDEPASGLDPRARIELMEILRELSRMGKTIFISSHILSELADLCDAVTLIDRGNIKFSGSMKDLLSHGDEQAVFRIKLVSEAETWSQKLESLECIDEAEFVEPDEVILRAEGQEVAAEMVLRNLIEADAPVVSFQEDVRHLNQVFMDLTEPGVRQ